MTRDEWVVLPVLREICSEPVPYRVRRDEVGTYWPETATTGAKVVWFMRRHTDLMFRVALPLAEFEALLFAPAPAASDDYTRAAVRYAEAMARLHAEPVRGNDLADAIGERDRTQHKFVALYRERHDAP